MQHRHNTTGLVLMKKYQVIIFALVFLTVLVGVVAQVVPVYQKRQQMQREIAEKAALLERVRGELSALQLEIQDLENKPAATEKVAREKFNYCREDETIYYFPE